MTRSTAVRYVLRRLRRLGLAKFLCWSVLLFLVLPVVLIYYHITHTVSPLSFLLKDMHEPKTSAIVPMPSAKASLVVVDMMNVHKGLVERWLYVRYENNERSDEELGYATIWPEPGRAGVDRYNTSTWVASHIALPAGEICNEIFIMMKMSNATGFRRLTFGLNNGMLHSFHGAMMRDNGSLVTVEQSAELIGVCRRWFTLVEKADNEVVHADYGEWIEAAANKSTQYGQIIIREREENDGAVVYFPKRTFSDVNIVRKLHQITTEDGYIVVFISRLDTSETEDIVSTYKSVFGAHCKLIEPTKTESSYLFCQKTSDKEDFVRMYEAINGFVEAGCIGGPNQ